MILGTSHGFPFIEYCPHMHRSLSVPTHAERLSYPAIGIEAFWNNRFSVNLGRI